MTTKQVIDLIEQSGHFVEYKRRSDGGIRITKIDGITYTGSTGNRVAREIAGKPLTEKQVKAREKSRPRVAPLPKEIKKKIKRVQRIWRKRFGKQSERPPQGKISMKKVRWILKHQGEERLLYGLDKKERYARGFAYVENVEHLIDEIRRCAGIYNSQALYDVADIIEKNKNTFLEENIYPCYEILYDLNPPKSDTPSNVANRLMAQIR